MTEIPEHLLNRSKARRAAASGESTGDAPAAASSAPAKSDTAPARAAAAPAPKAVAPDPAYVKAAKERQKIPFWAMGGLALLPIWALLYLAAMTPSQKEVAGPLSVGAAVYANCAGCHGAGGEGGAGRILAGGEVMKTFPRIEDMLNFVYNGSQKYQAAGFKTYGSPTRPGGAHAPLSYNGNPMPMQGTKAGGALTDGEILAVVCHERYTIGGADPAAEAYKEEYTNWCSPESEIFKALESGSSSFDSVSKDFSALKVGEVGTTPREALSK